MAVPAAGPGGPGGAAQPRRQPRRRPGRTGCSSNTSRPNDPLSRGAVLQAHRNSVARDALAAEFGLLSSSDVAELSGSAARNAGATAARWRAAGRIFAVTSGGKAALFPGFQFDAGGQPVQ